MKKEFGFWFWLHILILIPAYLSPILFDWWIIFIVAIILQIQYWLLGGCFLTHLELGKDKNETYLWYYLRKIFPNLSQKKMNITIRVIIPVVLIIISYILQNIFNLKPIFHF